MATYPQFAGAPAPSLGDEHVFLVGRPPISEFLSFVEAQTSEAATAHRAALMDQWRAANDHIRQLELDEAGCADNPPVQPLPDTLAPLGQQLLNDPITKSSFSFVPVELGIVELDRLVVFQKQINLAYVRALQQKLGASPSDVELFRFCLPFDRRNDPPVQMAQLAPNAWAFASPSQDFRPLRTVLLDPAQVQGLAVDGAPVAVVAQVVGYGSNYLSAIAAENRLVLNNGSHRAYALRDAGHTHVPCLIQRVSRADELEVVANGPLSSDADRYLAAPRPPILRDYFDVRLRMNLHVPRHTTQIQVGVAAQLTRAPGA